MDGVTRDGAKTGGIARLLLLAAILAGAFAAVRLTPVGGYLTREGALAGIEALRGSTWAPFVFIAIYTVATALAIPGTVLTLSGGALFGTAFGTLFNWIGANLGANIAFWMSRALGRDGVQRLLGDRAEALDRVTRDYGFRGLLTLRLVPLVPFNALNFGSGFTGISGGSYALATAIGILPGTTVYTFFADSLLQGSQEASREAWIRVLIAGLLLVALSLLPTMVKRFRKLPTGAALLLLALLPLSACGAEAAAGDPAARMAASTGTAGTGSGTADSLPSHAALSNALEGVVRAGLVDYAALQAARGGLDAYLVTLATVPEAALDAASRDEVLAFWINAYNACMLKRVLDHYPIQSARGLVSRVRGAVAGYPANSVQQIPDVFTGAHCRVAGAERSQDEIEHEILRPMGEPRIHFVINCAAVSCPELSPRALQGPTLEAQLDDAVRRFMADPRHFRVEGGTLTLNRVLDWFGEDFGGRSGVREFFAGYASGSQVATLGSDATDVEFFDYDWTLNDTGA